MTDKLGWAIAAFGVWQLWQTRTAWLPSVVGWLQGLTPDTAAGRGVDEALAEVLARAGDPTNPAGDVVLAAWQLAQAMHGDDPAAREQFRAAVAEAAVQAALRPPAKENP